MFCLKKLFLFTVLLLESTTGKSQAQCTTCDNEVEVDFKGSMCIQGSYTITLNGKSATGQGVGCAYSNSSPLAQKPKLKLNKAYNLSLTAIPSVYNGQPGGVSSVHLEVIAPPCYQVYIDGIETTTRDINEGECNSGQGLSRNFSVVLKSKTSNEAGSGGEGNVSGGSGSGGLVGDFSLGGATNGSVGSISFSSGTIAPILFTPAVLDYANVSSDVDVVRDSATQVLRQIKATEVLADIVTLTATSYEIRFYPSAQVGLKAAGLYPVPGIPAGGLYPVTGSASRIWRFSSPTNSASVAEIQVTKIQGTVEVQETFSFLSGTWMAVIPNVRAEMRTEVILPNGDKQIDVSVKNPTTGINVSVTRSVYHAFPWGTEKISSAEDPDGFNLVTRSTYNENLAVIESYGKLKWIVNPDGSWQHYQYVNSGLSIGKVSRILGPWTSLPVTPGDATLDNCHVTEYSYVSDGSSYLLPKVGKTVEKVGDIILSTSTMGYRIGSAQTDYAFSSGYNYGGFNPVYSTVSFLDDNGKLTARYQDSLSVTKHLRGRILFVKEADGRQKTFAYDRGTYLDGIFTPSVIGTYIRSYETVGSFSGTAFIESTSGKTPRLMTIHDPNGWMVCTETQLNVLNGIYDATSQTRYNYDLFGHLTQTTVNGRVTYDAVWSNGRLASETDEMGIITTYDAYDAENRITQQTRAGVTMTRIYDAAGRSISFTRSAGSLTLTTSTTYDSAGRLKTQTGEDGLVTTINYPSSRTTTRTNPDTSTEITQTFLDGRIFSITGTSGVATYYGYGVDSNGLCTTQWTGHTGERRYTKSWQNSNRDVWKTAKAVPYVENSNEYLPSQVTSITTFDPITKDRPISRTVLGEATILYAYDSETGAQTIQARDLNGNGVIDYTGADTIEKMETIYTRGDRYYYRQTVRSRYETDGQAVVTVTSTSREQLSGLGVGGLAAVSQSIDPRGNVTSQSSVINRATRTVTTTTDTPDSDINAVAITIDGKLSSSTTNTVSTPTVYNTYDALGRLITVTSPRGVVATTVYDSATGRVASATQAGNTTSYTYYPAGVPGAGRVAAETLPDTKVIRTAYSLRGEVFRVWGGATYPLERTYDVFGQLQFLKTYRGGTDWAGATWPANPGIADTTEWKYEGYTGQLEWKKDAAGGFTGYAYHSNGKIAARGRGRGIQTNYTWNSLGLLASTSHSDGTPTATTQYDRAGRQKTLVDAAGTHTYDYSNPLFTSETIVGGILGGVSRSVTRDTYERPSETSVTSGGTTHLTSYSYLGPRLQGVFTGAEKAMYSYLAHSDAIQSQTFLSGTTTRLTATRSYDSSDRLNGITNAYGTSQLQSYGVSEFDAMNRRKKITREDGTRWNYGYNDKGEVTSGIREKTAAPNTTIPGWSHGYSFDEIGNRLATTTNGRASTYTPNKLNQITSRTIPRAFDVLGKAATTAAVTVNSQATTRLDEFFYKELPAGGGAVHVPYSVAATDATGTPTTRNGGKFLPATPENFLYDLDGNLTSDGRFTYTWDAENRLIAMQTLATVSVIAQRKLAFAYDATGRRIRKTTWHGTAAGTWQPRLDLRFIHELGGWNVLAEITADSKFLRTYTWGTDLSGNLSGAGGVGGLLFTNLRASGKTFAHGMDLNGNVTLLVNTATSQAAATYDYGPFGEPLRQSGEYAKLNPYRFSTKYTDDETGLLDYGHRYYDPMTGRWPSKDPIEERGGMNLYGFVENNGIARIDMIGLSPGAFVRPNHITIFAGHGLSNKAFTDAPYSGDDTLVDPTSIDRAFNDPNMVPINANVSKTFAAATIIACNAPRYTHVNIPITGYNSPEGEIPLDNAIAMEMATAFNAAENMAKIYVEDGACEVTIEVKCFGFSKGLCGTKKIIR